MSPSLNEISPPDAWKMLQSNDKAVLIDVRTRMEYEYVGHPINAINLPWMDAPDWAVNTEFSKQAKALLAQKYPSQNLEELPLLLICRSGKRSEAAAQDLIANEFSNVYNIIEGFEGDRDNEQHRNTVNGWRFHNLPWEQS